MPDKTITKIGLAFLYSSINTQNTKMINIWIRKFFNNTTVSLPKKADKMIVSPAVAIKATTAGLR